MFVCVFFLCSGLCVSVCIGVWVWVLFSNGSNKRKIDYDNAYIHSAERKTYKSISLERKIKFNWQSNAREKKWKDLEMEVMKLHYYANRICVQKRQFQREHKSNFSGALFTLPSAVRVCVKHINQSFKSDNSISAPSFLFWEKIAYFQK